MSSITPPVLSTGQKLFDVLGVTRALTAEVNLDALLVKIMDAATRLLESERSTLYLIDSLTRELVSKIAQQAEIREIRLPTGTGLAGHVAVTGEVLVIADAQCDARFNREIDVQTGFHTRNMLVVPVANARGHRIGVIQVINRTGGAFTTEDVAVLQALASSAAVALDNAYLYGQIEAMLQSFVRTLAASIDARDPQTAGHSLRVGGYAAKLAREIGVDARQQKLIYLAGLLHDYGKIGVPESILTKPARLSDDEMSIMRGHASMSRDILRNVQFTEELNRIPEIVYQHHERIDGGGYPRGLRGHEISFEGRLLAVCDVFDALSNRRYYREAISHADAFSYIKENRDTHFDTDIADAFGNILLREGAIVELHPTDVTTATAMAREAEAQGQL